jgi:hypothetical protein
VWKNGVPPFDKALVFNKELTESDVLVDLGNGEAHRVLAITKTNKPIQGVPENEVRTLRLKTLSDDELASLRQQHGDAEYVILPIVPC